MTTYSNGSHPAVPSGSAIYVDTENLRDSDHAQTMVAQVVANWPADRPPLSGLSLYVRADRVASWEMWAEASYPDLRVRVRGVQHFSSNKAKNSADLAITADAVADLVTGQAVAIAVVSNDSDFGALFVKVKELAHSVGVKQPPFLWITSPEAGGLSAELERFIPAGLRWDLSETPLTVTAAPREISQPDPPSLPKTKRPAALPAANTQRNRSSATIPSLKNWYTKAAGRQVQSGRCSARFQSTMAGSSRLPLDRISPIWYSSLGKQIWPILQERGVLMTTQKIAPNLRNNASRQRRHRKRRTSAQVNRAVCNPPRQPHPKAVGRRRRLPASPTTYSRRPTRRTPLKPANHEHPAASLHRCPVRNLVRQATLAHHGAARRHHRQGKAATLRNDPRRAPQPHRPRP